MSNTELRPWRAMDGREGTRLYFWCPGCDDVHAVELKGEHRWEWDGNLDAPTISPSILVTGVQWAIDSPFHKTRHHVEASATITCHSFVRAGQWEFLGDCTHDLAGQTVPMLPWPREGGSDG